MRSSPVSGSTIRPRRCRARSYRSSRMESGNESGCGAQAQDLACFGGRCRASAVALAVVGDLLHQLGVARGELVGVDLQVVLEAGAAMAAGLEAPLVHFPLETRHTRRDPGGAGQDLRDLASQ